MKKKTLEDSLSGIRYPNNSLWGIAVHTGKWDIPEPILPYKIECQIKSLTLIAEILEPKPTRESKALIVGPELGTEIVLLHKLGYKVLAVELEEQKYPNRPHWIELSRDFIRENCGGLKITKQNVIATLDESEEPVLFLGDASSLPEVPNSCFDIAFSFHTGDYHSPHNNWAPIYSETARVMRPEGYFVLTYSAQCIQRLETFLYPYFEIISRHKRDKVEIFGQDVSNDRELFVTKSFQKVLARYKS